MSDGGPFRPDELGPLLAMVAAGDEEALGAFYDSTCGLVYGLALRILRHAADAEEVTFDVYAQVWRRAPTFDDRRGTVHAWLATLTRSRAVDRLRARAVRDRVGCAGLDGLDAAVHCDGADESAHWADFGRRARAALGGLPARERELVELAFFEGCTHTELAERLGLPLGTVKTRIRSALSRLRFVLAEFDPASRAHSCAR